MINQQKFVNFLGVLIDDRAHTTLLFSKLKILDIFKLNSFYVAKFVFSYHHRLLPPSFLNLFVTNNLVNSYITPEGVQIFVLIFVELMLNSFLYFFKVQKCGIRYQMILSNLNLYSVLKDDYTIFYSIDRYNYILVVVTFFPSI